MEPSELRPGQKIQIKFNLRVRDAIFVKRCQETPGRFAKNVFMVPDFAGLNGPDDKGLCHMSDNELSKKLTIPEEQQ